MKTRKEQVEKMTAAKKQESFRRLAAELRESAPTATSHLDDDGLMEIIKQATDKALAYGVRSSKATTAFVKMAVFAGISFDQDPSVQQFLKSPDLELDYKVTLLAEAAAQKVKNSV